MKTKNGYRLIALAWRMALLGIGFGIVFAGTAITAFGKHTWTPEIDPGSMGNAMALLIGGVFIVSGRLYKKK